MFLALASIVLQVALEAAASEVQFAFHGALDS